MIFRNAKRRGIVWNITYTEVMELVEKPCVYCGLEANEQIINGIDRIDSSIGYSVENCVPCCSDCNYAKNAKSPELFKEYIRRVYSWMTQEAV